MLTDGKTRFSRNVLIFVFSVAILCHMELNLESARIAREVEARIKAELGRLPATEQKSVLERVAVDVLSALSSSNGSASVGRVERVPPPSPGGAGGDKAWQLIETYCKAHPTTDGTFHNVAVAEALFPDKVKAKRNAAISMVFTSTKRRSLGESKDPHFVLLGDARFRLITPEDLTKAKEKRLA